MVAAGVSVVLLITLSLFVLLHSEPSSNIGIDGRFSDWNDSPMYSDVSDENNEHIDIIGMAIDRDSIYLSFYVETKEDMFEGFGIEGDVVRIFIDTDSNVNTGYAINWIGADYLIEMYGYGNRILSSSYYEYDVNHRTETPRGQYDWNAWSSMFEADSAVKGTRMEAQLWVDELNIPSGAEPRALIQITDPRGNQDVSPVFNSYGALETEIIGKNKRRISKSESNEFLTLVLNNRGPEPVMVTGLTFTHDSTAVRDDIEKASLHLDGELLAIGSFDGKRLTFNNLELLIESFKNLNLELTVSDDAVAGHVVSLELTDIVTDAGVSYSRDKVVAYIEDAPAQPVVDGLFEEWTDPMIDEVGDVSDPNIDISAYDARNNEENTYFYFKVEGNMLHGNAVASTRAMNIPSEGGNTAGSSDSDDPPQSSGTQEESPLPVETGEDSIYIFLETKPVEGYENDHIAFGADSMIEIKGIGGEITSAKYFDFTGENPNVWGWRFVKIVEAASGLKEIESVIDAVPLNIYYHLVGWNAEEDWSEIMDTITIDYSGTRAYKTITLDSDLSDWVGQYCVVDALPDADGASGDDDILRVWIANDATYIYVRWDVGAILSTTFCADVHIDVDDDPGSFAWDITLYFGVSAGAFSILEVWKLNGDETVLWDSTSTDDYEITQYNSNTKTALQGRFPRSQVSPAFDIGEDFIATAHTHQSLQRRSTVTDNVPDTGDTYTMFGYDMATTSVNSYGYMTDTSSNTILITDSNEAGVSDVVDIVELDFTEDTSNYYVEITCAVSVTPTSDTYAVFLDTDTDGTFDYAYDNSDATTAKLYTWSTDTWGSGTTKSSAVSASGTSITFTIAKSDIGSHSSFWITVATDDDGVDRLSQSGDNNDQNDPVWDSTDSTTYWDDFLDAQEGAASGHGNPQPVPEFSHILFLLGAIFILFIAVNRKKS